MRISVLPALLLCAGFATGAGAQIKTLSFSLVGTLGVQGGESFTYEINATDSAGTIKGFALTYARPGMDTRARITGKLDRAARTLTFHETEIVYNKGFSSEATLCLISARLSYHKDESGNLVLSGPINSSDLGNAQCSGGSILFSNGAAMRPLFDPVPDSNTRPTTAAAASPKPATPKPAEPPKPQQPVIYVYDTAIRRSVPVTPPAGPETITAGKEKVLEWESDTVVLEIWDGGHIDGDVISVLYNDLPVIARYPITATRKTLRLPLPADGKPGVITILAENEGAEPPNTANILLHDGSREYPVVAYNAIRKEAVIRVRRKR